MEDIVIAGHGGFAKEVAWLIERINAESPAWRLLGYIDNAAPSSGVIGDDDFVISYASSLSVVLAIGNGAVRKRIYERYRHNKNILFPTLIDPSVRLSGSVSYGKGNIICAGSIMTVDIGIGDFNIINLDCTVGHGAVIGDYVTVNPSVNISGDVMVGSCVSIGTGAQIIQGMEIGEAAVIGAGAVVTSNIEGGCTSVGIPARPVRRRAE